MDPPRDEEHVEASALPHARRVVIDSPSDNSSSMDMLAGQDQESPRQSSTDEGQAAPATEEVARQQLEELLATTSEIRKEHVDMCCCIIQAFPLLACEILDESEGYPLHWVAAHASSEAQVQVVHQAYPGAIQQANGDGELPHHVAQQANQADAIVSSLKKLFRQAVTGSQEVPQKDTGAHAPTSGTQEETRMSTVELSNQPKASLHGQVQQKAFPKYRYVSMEAGDSSDMDMSQDEVSIVATHKNNVTDDGLVVVDDVSMADSNRPKHVLAKRVSLELAGGSDMDMSQEDAEEQDPVGLPEPNQPKGDDYEEPCASNQPKPAALAENGAPLAKAPEVIEILSDTESEPHEPMDASIACEPEEFMGVVSGPQVSDDTFDDGSRFGDLEQNHASEEDSSKEECPPEGTGPTNEKEQLEDSDDSTLDEPRRQKGHSSSTKVKTNTVQSDFPSEVATWAAVESSAGGLSPQRGCKSPAQQKSDMPQNAASAAAAPLQTVASVSNGSSLSGSAIVATQKRKRGRPRKHQPTAAMATAAPLQTVASVSNGSNLSGSTIVTTQKRKRGRPRKDQPTNLPEEAKPSLKQKRGRPPKPKRKRGRPRKHQPANFPEGLGPGSRVYAKWTNGKYYWGTIYGIRPTSSADPGEEPHYVYSIYFDDGDDSPSVSREDFHSAEYMKTLLKQTPPSMKKDLKEHVRQLTENHCQSPEKTSQIAEAVVNLQEENPGLNKANLKCACENCTKEPCGQCANCSADGGRSEYCFQKMCFEMPVDEKAEKAVGFPEGWRFYFAKEQKYKGPCRFPQIPSLWILAPNKLVFRSAKAAIARCRLEDGDRIKSEFYSHVGLRGDIVATESSVVDENNAKCGFDDDDDDETSIEASPNKKQKTKARSSCDTTTTTAHFLVGQKVVFKWTDLKRRQRAVLGEVTACNKRGRSVVSFNVSYDSASRELLAKSCGGGWATEVPEVQQLPVPLVWGGCVAFSEDKNRSERGSSRLRSHLPSLYWSWLTPTMRSESFETRDDGSRFPCLTLVHEAFQLTFKVKPSRIEGAGNGVFVSTVSLMGDADALKLKRGQVMSLGIYAPLLLQDRKLQSVFCVKNFIHGFKCAEFAFCAGNDRYEFDITDDVTGELHSDAKAQILPYMNETFDKKAQNVFPLHDPEGNVHYMLGHSEASQGDLILPADGSETELLVNYGEKYEGVRVRKGYSPLSPEEREEVLAVQDLYLEKMDEFPCSELKKSVDFLFGLFSKNSDIEPEVSKRALTCAVVLQRRARMLLLNGECGGRNDESVNMGNVLRKLDGLISILIDMKDAPAELRQLHLEGNCEKLLNEVFQQHGFSADELKDLQYMMED